MSVLLEGQRGTGKTAIAAKLAVESDFPLVRLVSPDSMIGMQDSQKCQLLLKVFLFSFPPPDGPS
jgi:vesicle-fusing ATPase